MAHHGAREKLATTSAVTLDGSDNAQSPIAAPHKALVDELMNLRRDRYRQIRLHQGADRSYIFPPPAAASTAKATHLEGGRQASTAPVQLAAPTIDGAESEEGSEKLQGQRTAHLLLRVLALSYIVPLCDASDEGIPDKLTRQGYSVQDSLRFMRSLLIEQSGILEHTFRSRPESNSDVGVSTPFDSTTLDLWLIPRVLTAAAVLSVRCTGYLPGGDEKIRQSLLDLAKTVLCLSIQPAHQSNQIRMLLRACLRASLRSIAHTGRPSFLPTSAPPVALLPEPGEHDEPVSFFAGSEEFSPLSSASRTKPFGNGINRLWMEEDHATFVLDIGLTEPEAILLFSRALLLVTCQACSQVGSAHPAELFDLGDTAASLLLSSWQWDEMTDDRLLKKSGLSLGYLDACRIEVVSDIISDGDGLLHTALMERLSTMILRQAATAISDDVQYHRSLVIALQKSLALMRSKPATISVESVACLKPHLSSLVGKVCTPLVDTTDSDNTEAAVADAPRKPVQVKLLALEALLLLLSQGDKHSQALLQETEREMLAEVFLSKSASNMEFDQVSKELSWLSAEHWNYLIEVIKPPRSIKDLPTGTMHLPLAPFPTHPHRRAEKVSGGSKPPREDSGSLKVSGNGIIGEQDTPHDPNALPLHSAIMAAAKALLGSSEISTRERCILLLCKRFRLSPPDRLAHDNPRQMCAVIKAGMNDKSRRIRLLVAVRLVPTYVEKFCQYDQGMATFKKVDSIFNVFREVLRSGHARAREAALLGLSHLARIDAFAVQAHTLPLLVLQLGSDSMHKSMAYCIITLLANDFELTVFQFLAPFLDTISVQIIERIHTTPTLFLEVLQLTNQNQAKFLQTTLPYTLPYVLEVKDEKTLSLIARGIGQDIQTMCFNSTPAILKYFLMQTPLRRDHGIMTFIETVRGDGAHDINLRSLLKSYSVELLGHLVTRLGDPDQRKGALSGLHHMNSVLHDRPGGANKSASSKEMSLSSFLKDEILAILSWINDELMNAHGKKTIAHKCMVAESIGVLISVVGQSIAVVTPQLMATMNTTMQVQELMLPTLQSWHTFITKLGYAVVGPFIGQTAAALVASWPRFGSGEKEVARKILSYIVMHGTTELKPFLLQDFPNLEDLRSDIPDICDKLASIGPAFTKKPELRLQHILDRAANENMSICGQALAELKTFLNRERAYVQRMTSGNTFDPVIGRIVHILFATLARDDETDTLRDICLENMGMLGAIDPDRFRHDGADQTTELLQDFEDKDEIGDFAVHLIRDLLVSAFKATSDTKHQAALAYAIQELLKLAGFSAALLPQNGAQMGSRGATVALRIRQRWLRLPPEMLDTIAPLLESKYSVHLGDMSRREKPIYRHCGSFKEWVQYWTNQLIVGASGEWAKAMFGIFRSVIRDHDLSIAQYILPHLVLNILVLGDEAQRQEIRDEIVAVLEDQVIPTTDYEPERRLMSAQVIFALFDHLSVWNRTRSHDKHKQSRRVQGETEAALARVDWLTNTISQELMAVASLKCRAYARSLLNFEQRIRALRLQGKDDKDLQEHYENMHLIYANLDEPDGMEGISTRVISASLEHQIREHESTGRWTAAQSCWEVKIQQKPDDLTLHLGLLRCLRNLGHYDTMRTHIRGVLAVHPEWETRVDSFYVEGCCILSDWEEVKKRFDGHGLSSPAHATARVMLAMHQGDHRSIEDAMKEARGLLGKPLVAAGRNSYVSVYDSVTQLHMLHELGMISEALGISISLSSSSGPSDASFSPWAFEDLRTALAARLDSTLPSFKTREPLLSLRRSAFSTRNQTTEFRAEIGQSWISSSKIARRSGHIQSAYSAALQASQWKAPFAFVQQAKLLALNDQGQAALQEVRNALTNLPRGKAALDKGSDYVHTYANTSLFAARLADQAGRSRPNEIIEQYKSCTELDPQSEKMWYYLGHYYDQISEGDQANSILVANRFTQHINTMRFLLKSAVFGTKFFYRSLPRVLTIWLQCGDDESVLAAAKPAKTNSKQHISTEEEYKAGTFRQMNDLMRRYIRKLAPYQWLAVYPQMVSRLVHKNESVWKLLVEIICHVAEEYPHQAMWTMIAGSQSKDAERKRRFNDIVTRLRGNAKAKSSTAKIVTQTLQIAKELLYLCDLPVSAKDNHFTLPEKCPRLLSLADGELILPLQNSISVNMPGNYKADSDHRAFEKDLPRIIGFDPKVDVMSSLQRPRKLTIFASDGKHYPFLCKPKDDLRKDARLMEFDTMINNLLQSNSESRKRRLYIRTYSVITLNEECGLIEWVPNTTGLRFILGKLYRSREIPLYSPEVQRDMDKARADPRNAGEIFEKTILSKYPPVFHDWFIATFPEPSAWLKARLAYAHTLAVMSMVGYVLGLGDRHGENILFDSESGDTVHVDLNCLFDKGTLFEIPERVPFRLTQNLVDALGVTGYEGVFRRAAEISMGILRDNKDSLMSVLEAMVHDPLVEWGIDNRSKTKTPDKIDPRILQARKALDPVGQKLNGKLKRSNLQGSGGTSAGWTSAYSTNSLVDALIRDATSNALLAQMYVGWSSWL